MHSSRVDLPYPIFKFIRFRTGIQILICVIVFTCVIFWILCLLNDIHGIVENEVGRVEQNETLVRQMHHFDQNDSQLIEMLKSTLIPPSAMDYRLFNPLPVIEHALEREVRQINRLKRGFFVEVGAGDGETRSPTLCLEYEDGWSGLLIEADPRLVQVLLRKQRKSLVDMSCVGVGQHSYVGYLCDSRVVPEDPSCQYFESEVQCYPLYTHLKAAGLTVVDFMVLNINGGELEVLRSLPWYLIDVKIISVRLYDEYEIPSTNYFMEEKGYSYLNVVSHMDESFILYSKKIIPNLHTSTTSKPLPTYRNNAIKRIRYTQSIWKTPEA